MKKDLSYAMIVLILPIIIGFQACAKKDVKKDQGIEETDVSGAGGKVGPVEIGYSGRMNVVHFDYDQSTLTEETRETLKNNAEWLKETKGVKAQIEGHCDSRGTPGYNMGLGQKRADAVRKYLVDLGIGSGRLSSISYGEERPIESAETEDAWAKNRRAEFIITDK